jgi:EmrB/QacA subfamily drug resistance transporter
VTRTHRWWVMVAVTLATFITTLDNLVVNIALPSMTRDLGLSLSGVEWVVSGYILTFSGLMLVGGRLADVYGRRAVFLAGVAVFVAASLAAGLAGSQGTLIAARVVQGVGAALATPTCLAIVRAVFTDERERSRAIAVWTGVSALALAVGPPVGGLISQHLDWSWIFFLNAPVGAVAFALATVLLPESRDRAAGTYVDLGGLVTSGVALLCVTFVLIQGHGLGWGSAPIVLAAVVGAVAAVGFVLVERRVPAPMVDMWFFRNRLFGGGTGIQLAWGLGFTGVLLFTSLYLQDVLGFSPTGAGLLYLPLAVALVAGAPVAPLVSSRIGAHRAGAVGFGVAAVGLLLLTTAGQHAGTARVLPSFVLVGLGTALTTPLTSVVLGVLPEERSGVGSSVLNAAREVSGLLGVVVVGAVLVARQNAALHGGQGRDAAFVQGYQAGLLVGAAFVVLAALISWVALSAAAGTGRTAAGRTQPHPPSEATAGQ